MLKKAINKVQSLFSEKKPKGRGLYKPVGIAGNEAQDGQMPDIDFNPEWNYPNYIPLVDEMDKQCPILSRSYDEFTSPIKAAKYFISPCPTEDKLKEAEEQQRFIEEAIEHLSLPFSELMAHICTAPKFGHSLLRWHLKAEQDKEGKDKVYMNLLPTLAGSVEKWETNDKGDFIGVTQRGTDGKEHFVPIEQMIGVTYNKEGVLPIGQSIYRKVYFNYFEWYNFKKFNMNRQERASGGIFTVNIGRNYAQSAETDDKVKAKLEHAIAEAQALRNSKNAVVSNIIGNTDEDTIKTEMLDQRQLGDSGLKESIEEAAKDIALGLKAEFITITSGGSYSMHEDKRVSITLASQAFLNYIAHTLNQYCIKPLIDFNFDNPLYPTIQFEKLGDVVYKDLALAIKHLTESNNWTPNYDTEQWLRELMEAPDISEEEYEEKHKQVDEMNPDESQDKDLDPEGKEQAKDNKKEKEDQKKDVEKEEKKEKKGKKENKKGEKEYSFAESKKKLIYHRPLFYTENKVDWDKLEDYFNRSDKEINDILKELSQSQKESLLNQIEKAVSNNDLQDIKNIKIDAKYKSKMIKSLVEMAKRGYDFGMKTVKDELSGLKLEKPKEVPEDLFELQNEAIINKYLNTLEESAKLTASQAISKAGSIASITASKVIGDVGDKLDNLIKKQSLGTLSVQGSVNMGRDVIATLNKKLIHSATRSAILDRRCCHYCLSLDGRTVKLDSSDYSLYSVPSHHRCRCIWVYTHKEELVKPKITGIPKSIPKTTDIDSYEPLKSPVLKKDSPARKVVEQEISDRKVKLEKLDGKYPNRQEQHKDLISRLEKSLK